MKEIIGEEKNVKIVANLPYYITTPIVMKLLEENLKMESITVMVQKEVGERFCANPDGKEYGAITVSINYYSNPKIVLEVPKDNFNPIPEVDSLWCPQIIAHTGVKKRRNVRRFLFQRLF